MKEYHIAPGTTLIDDHIVISILSCRALAGMEPANIHAKSGILRAIFRAIAGEIFDTTLVPITKVLNANTNN